MVGMVVGIVVGIVVGVWVVATAAVMGTDHQL
jgi:hypothetical protein